MIRLNLALLAVLAACALGLVTSQHQARKLFSELEHEQERARSLEVEYGQLQLESSTWAMHARIERIATRQLGMRTPDAKHLRIIQPAPLEAMASNDVPNATALNHAPTAALNNLPQTTVLNNAPQAQGGTAR